MHAYNREFAAHQFEATVNPGGFFFSAASAVKEHPMKGISPSKSYAADEAKWRTESDLRTLQDAEAIKKDPKRMKAAQELAKKKLMEMASIAGDAEHGKG